MVDRGQRRSTRVVLAAALLMGFAVAHVVEDFVYGVPARFGLALAPAAVLVGGVFALHAWFIALAARGRRAGYTGNVVFGVGWFLAAAGDHLGDLLFTWPYREGLVSKLFVVGLLATALWLAVAAYLARRVQAGTPGG